MATEVLNQASTNGWANEDKTYFSLKLLARLVPALEHANHGVAEDIPEHAGRVIEKRRFESYPAQTSALTEGTPPAAIQGTWSRLLFTVSQYGAYSLVSDILTMQGFDGIEDMVNAFGENAGNSIDQIIRDTLVVSAGAQVLYASTAGSRGGLGSGMRLTSTEVRKAVHQLRLNNAKTFEDNYFHAIIHPDTEFDLSGDPSITQVMLYAADRGEGNPQFQGTVPVVYGVKFFRTTNAKTVLAAGLSSADVYVTLFLGKEAYLVSKFSTQNVRTIIKPVGSAGAVDALDQYGSIGWKASVVAGVLNTKALVQYEHTSSLGAKG